MVATMTLTAGQVHPGRVCELAALSDDAETPPGNAAPLVAGVSLRLNTREFAIEIT